MTTTTNVIGNDEIMTLPTDAVLTQPKPTALAKTESKAPIKFNTKNLALGFIGGTIGYFIKPLGEEHSWLNFLGCYGLTTGVTNMLEGNYKQAIIEFATTGTGVYAGMKYRTNPALSYLGGAIAGGLVADFVVDKAVTVLGKKA